MIDNDGDLVSLASLFGSLLQFGIHSGRPFRLTVDRYEFHRTLFWTHYAGLAVFSVLEDALNSLKSAVGVSFWTRSFNFHACQLKKR